jgi:uncharacterized protein
VTVTGIDRLGHSTFDLFTIARKVVNAGGQYRSLAEPPPNEEPTAGKLRSPARPCYARAAITPHLIMSSALVPPELLDPVVAYFHPRRVILFGSAARGDAGPDSDIDLPVIVDDDTPPEKLTLKAGYESRQSYDNPTDIFPCREQTCRRKCQIVGTLPYAARTEGIVVYERP